MAVTTDLIVLENQIPKFNPEARLIKSYKALIERDKGSVGDADGRKKLKATKELAFVALYVSLTSPYNRNYEVGAERTNELKRQLDLPTDWKPDAILQEAMKEYEKTQVTPSSAMLISTRNAIYSSRNIVGILEKRLKKRMDDVMLAEMLDDDELDKLIDKAKSDIDSLLKYSSSLTKQLDDLNTLENRYVKEIEEAKGKNKAEVNYHEV